MITDNKRDLVRLSPPANLRTPEEQVGCAGGNDRFSPENCAAEVEKSALNRAFFRMQIFGPQAVHPAHGIQYISRSFRHFLKPQGNLIDGSEILICNRNFSCYLTSIDRI